MLMMELRTTVILCIVIIIRRIMFYTLRQLVSSSSLIFRTTQSEMKRITSRFTPKDFVRRHLKINEMMDVCLKCQAWYTLSYVDI